MNDIVNDLQTLEKIKDNIRNVSPHNAKSLDLLLETIELIEPMVREKENIIHAFESNIQQRDELINSTDEVLQFNGQSSQSCEDFTLHKNIREPRYEDDMVELYEDDMVEFNFCKTQQHPYDEVVWKLLKFIKFVVLDPKDKSFSISNDNAVSYE